jgi:hypothetical protein
MRGGESSNSQNQDTDDFAKYSLLRHNIKALFALFFVTACGGVLAWRSNITTFIHNPTPQWFGAEFACFYREAQVFLSGGDITHIIGYLGAPNATLRYLYPLPSIYLFVPFAYLSFDQARIVWAAICVAALLLTVLLITKILQQYGSRLSKLEVLLIGIALFLFDPVEWNLVALNVNLLILLLITLFYYLFFVKKRAAGAGIVLGVAALIKIWPLVFVFLDFLHKSKKMLAVVVATIATISISALLLQGISLWLRWFAMLGDFDSERLVVSKDAILSPSWWEFNISISRSITKVALLFDLDSNIVPIILSAVKIFFIFGIFLFLFKVGKSKKDHSKLKEWDVLSFSLLMVSFLAVSNLVWSYYTAWLVLSFVLIIYVVPLAFIEKIVLIISLGLFLTWAGIASLCWLVGGMAKTIVYTIPPQTIAYVLLVSLIIWIIRDRAKTEYWLLPPA